MWNRKANIEMAKLKYGMNQSSTLLGLGINDMNDIEMTGILTPGFDVIDIKEDENTRITRPRKTGKKTTIYEDYETEIWL